MRQVRIRRFGQLLLPIEDKRRDMADTSRIRVIVEGQDVFSVALRLDTGPERRRIKPRLFRVPGEHTQVVYVLAEFPVAGVDGVVVDIELLPASLYPHVLRAEQRLM